MANENNNTQFTRQPAGRLPACLINDSTFNFKKGEGQFEPNWTITPDSRILNRILVMGVLTEREDIGQESENWKCRIVDPTGTTFMYAGQYQPEAQRAVSELDDICYVAVAGKPRTYQPDENTTLVSLTPDSIFKIDATTYARWLCETAQQMMYQINLINSEVQPEEVAKSEAIYGPYNIELAKHNIDLLLNTAAEITGEPVLDLDQGTPADPSAAPDPTTQPDYGTPTTPEPTEEPNEKTPAIPGLQEPTTVPVTEPPATAIPEPKKPKTEISRKQIIAIISANNNSATLAELISQAVILGHDVNKLPESLTNLVFIGALYEPTLGTFAVVEVDKTTPTPSPVDPTPTSEAPPAPEQAEKPPTKQKAKPKPKAKKVNPEIQGFVDDVLSIWDSPKNLTMDELMTKLSEKDPAYNAMKIGGLLSRVQELGLAYQPTNDTITFVT